jgi:hypothetical protein
MNLTLKQMQQKPVHPLMLNTRATMHLNNALQTKAGPEVRIHLPPAGSQERTVRSEYNRVWIDNVPNILSIVRDEAGGDGSKSEEIDRDRGRGFEQSARCTR